MSENPKVKKYERRITPLERFFSRSPFSIVTVVARIKGTVSERLLRNAVSQVRQRHPNLRVRIVEDDDHVRSDRLDLNLPLLLRIDFNLDILLNGVGRHVLAFYLIYIFFFNFLEYDFIV